MAIRISSPGLRSEITRSILRLMLTQPLLLTKDWALSTRLWAVSEWYYLGRRVCAVYDSALIGSRVLPVHSSSFHTDSQINDVDYQECSKDWKHDDHDMQGATSNSLTSWRSSWAGTRERAGRIWIRWHNEGDIWTAWLIVKWKLGKQQMLYLQQLKKDEGYPRIERSD